MSGGAPSLNGMTDQWSNCMRDTHNLTSSRRQQSVAHTRYTRREFSEYLLYELCELQLNSTGKKVRPWRNRLGPTFIGNSWETRYLLLPNTDAFTHADKHVRLTHFSVARNDTYLSLPCVRYIWLHVAENV